MTTILQNPLLLTILLTAAIAIAIALIVAATVLIAKSRAAGDGEKVEALEPRVRATWLSAGQPGMGASFREAMKRLRERFSGRGFPYRVPWYMMVGEPGSGKSSVANALGGASSEVVESDSETPRWLLLDQAVLIDLPGTAVISGEAAGGKNGTSDHPAFRGLLERAASGPGDTSHRTWRAFLSLAARYRPRQPLNGIVLTVPATELIAAATDPDHPRRIRRLSILARRLDEVQRFTGLRLPVYVLLTKCDVVPGFVSYARSIFQDAARQADRPDTPLAICDDLFGWSNPYSLDSDYSSGWVDEAFDETHEVLLQRQLEVLAETNSVEAADAVFLLPFEFDRLREPLQILLDLSFRTTAYRNPHLLRGIYFCGREEEPPTGKLSSGGAQLQLSMRSSGILEPSRGRALFVRDLFHFKVFAERFLATPVSRGYLSGNRSVLAAQITACALLLLFSIGLYRGYTRISALEQNTLNPVLESLTGSLTNISDTPEADVTPAVNLLNSLGATSESAYASPAMPFSYLDGFRHNLHNTLEGIFEFVVLKSCAGALEARISALLDTTYSAPAAATQSEYPPGNAWSADPAYLALDRYLTDLKALDENIERYTSISSRGQGSYAQLNELLHYLGGRGIPDTSRFAHDPQYQRLLLNAVWQPLQIPVNYDRETQDKASTLIEDFYHDWFDSNQLVAEAQNLSGSEGLQALTATKTPSNAQLLALVNDAQSMDTQLNSGSYDWIAGSFDREKYPALGPKLDQVSFADAAFTDRLQVEGEEKLSALKDMLAKYPGVLDMGDGKVRLDPGVRALAAVLNTILGYDWMAAEAGGGSCSTVPTTAVWNQADLGEAVQIEAARTKVVDELLPALPDAYRDQVQAIVDERAGNAIFLALEDAAASGDSAGPAANGLEAELESFSLSAGLLDQIAGGAARLHATAASSCMRRVLTRQAAALLTSVNNEAAGLYSPQPFAAGSSINLPASQWAYGVTTAADLQNYLAGQQQTAENLDAGAAPLVKVLRTVGSRSSSLATWPKFGKDIDALETKKPDNPVQALEAYISTDLDQIAPENGCKSTTPALSSDMFLKIRVQLSEMAVNRCRQVALARYGQIAAEFNSLLAGRFPFSAAIDTRPGAEASPANIAEFYGALDSNSSGLSGALAGATQNPAPAQAFLQDVAGLRPLVLSLATPPGPALTVSVEFRSNREREILADHIASWTLKFGQQTVASAGSGGGNDVAGALPQWQYGEPVTLIVNYAYDSPMVPSAANRSVAVHVKGGTVTYTYSDPWALFALLSDHAPDPGGPQDEYALIIPNQYPAAQNKSSSPADTVAYIKIDLLPAGAKPGAASIAVPPIPFSAPAAAPKSASGAAL